MFRIIILSFLVLLTAAPVFGLSLQERMELIKQQEQARRVQVQQKYDAEKPKPAAVVKTPSVAPALPTAKVTKTQEPKATLASDMSQSPPTQQVAPAEENTTITDSKGLMPDQLWKGQRGTASNVTQYRLFIDAIADEEVSAILNTRYRGDNKLFVVKGSFDRVTGILDLHTIDHLSSRTYDQPQIVGKLTGDKKALNTKIIYERYSFEIELKLISGADSEIREVLTPARETLQAKAEQQRQRDYYQNLVITPEYDKYGVETLETIKLENEKRLLRPLSIEEFEQVKNKHDQQVNKALVQERERIEAEEWAERQKKQQELEVKRLLVEQEKQAQAAKARAAEQKKQAQAAEARVAEQKKQEQEAQLKRRAMVVEREKEALVIFNALSVADASIERGDVRKIVADAGGNYIDPEQLKKESQGLLTIDDPSIDFFDTSSLLPGTSTGTAYFVPVKSMFGTDEVFAFFDYEFDDLSVFQQYQQKLLEKYGSPAEQGPNYLAWNRDSGKSGILLLAQPATSLLEEPSFSLKFVNQENMQKLQKLEEAQGKKQNNNF